MSDPEKEGLSGALTTVLASDETKALVAEYVEIGVDGLFKEGLAREIPLVGTIVGLAKIGVTVRDRLFAEKLLELMRPLADVDAAERAEMIARLERDPAYGRRVGQHLIEIADRIELHRKPPMIGAIFLAYQRREIDASMLNRLNHAVQTVPALDIDSLRPFCEATLEQRRLIIAADDGSLIALHNLQVSGLLHMGSAFGGSMAFAPNEVAEAFLRLELDRVK